ncbi:MAG: hypothetical protein KatS3mg105_3863 [Gemmatales bacterium]|nr:MAG: hypothetical protein KatS3mg105_3863 [Gemmatales bacterium]
MNATEARSASSAKPQNVYNSVFWLAYLANVSLMTANALTFRFAELVAYLGGSEKTAGTIVSVGVIGALLTRLQLGQAIDRFGTRPAMGAQFFVVSFRLRDVPRLSPPFLGTVCRAYRLRSGPRRHVHLLHCAHPEPGAVSSPNGVDRQSGQQRFYWHDAWYLGWRRDLPRPAGRKRSLHRAFRRSLGAGRRLRRHRRLPDPPRCARAAGSDAAGVQIVVATLARLCRFWPP